MNLGFFLSLASSQGYFSCMYQKHHHIWRNGKLPDAAIDVFLTALCWETSCLIHSPLAPRHVFVTTANLFQPSSSGCHILDSLSQRARKGLGDCLLLVSYQSMWGLLWHCLRLLPGMQEICLLLKHLWDQSTPQACIYSRTNVGRQDSIPFQGLSDSSHFFPTCKNLYQFQCLEMALTDQLFIHSVPILIPRTWILML